MKTETDPSTSKKPEPTLKLKCDHRDYPYECDKLNCHALFKSKKSLRQHTKNKHLKDWNKTMPRLHCSNCDEIFRSPAHLRSHQDFCINTNYYPCEKCGEKFTLKKFHDHRKLCYGLGNKDKLIRIAESHLADIDVQINTVAELMREFYSAECDDCFSK